MIEQPDEREVKTMSRATAPNAPYILADYPATVKATDLEQEEWQPVEDYIAGLERHWSPLAAGIDKTMVAGNLRTFWHYMARRGKPTRAEELLYEFVKIAPEVIERVARQPHGYACKDELGRIFTQACHALIKRQGAGVDFSHLNGQRVTAAPSLQTVQEQNQAEERGELSTRTKA
jgi:hypothetical protein